MLLPMSFLTLAHACTSRIFDNQIMSKLLEDLFIVAFIHLFQIQGHHSQLGTITVPAMFTTTRHKSCQVILAEL